MTEHTDLLAMIGTVIVGFVAMTGLIIVVIKMQFVKYDETMARLDNTMTIIFNDIKLKKSSSQCLLDRKDCPCVIETKGLTVSQNKLSKRVDVLDEKHDKLRESVIEHHAKHEQVAVT